MWTGFAWLGKGMLWRWWWTFRFHKGRERSWAAGPLKRFRLRRGLNKSASYSGGLCTSARDTQGLCLSVLCEVDVGVVTLLMLDQHNRRTGFWATRIKRVRFVEQCSASAVQSEFPVSRIKNAVCYSLQVPYKTRYEFPVGHVKVRPRFTIPFQC
jgi:hypothetical protein